jgi:putative phosphoribosyl transferase
MDYSFNNEVSIPIGKTFLQGELIIPKKAEGVIIFSHGSGSSRMSPRNRKVAKDLQDKKFGTLLLDLLTPGEDRNYNNRFDIELLTQRLIGATEWLEEQHSAKNCSVGYFGASTGAASALKAAAKLQEIEAVVCRGGRADLAMKELPKVSAATLLIVGSLDTDVLKLSKEAYAKLDCIKHLEIVDGASHLFGELGMMDRVSSLASDWFTKHLFRMAFY